MRMTDVDQGQLAEITAETIEAAARGVPELEARHKETEVAFAAATTEQDRCRRVLGMLQQLVLTAQARYKEAKRKALESVAMEREDAASFKDYLREKERHAFALDSLSYLGSYTVEDANRAALLAEAAEREAHADVTEAKAVVQRLALIRAAADAEAYDPGAKIDLENSWSAKQMDAVRVVRQRTIPDLQRSIQEHDARVERERQLIARGLWS